MNFNSVVCGIAAANLIGKQHALVKVTSTGIALAGVNDRPVGTLLTGADTGGAVDVFLVGNGLHYAQIGGNGALVAGDELERAANGELVKRTTGQTVAIAWEPLAANNSGAQIRVVLLSPAPAISSTAVTLTSTNGTAAGAADLAALKAETEKVGDDVRAIHAALVTAGIITA